jgi:WXG100 family type VII secretion target
MDEIRADYDQLNQVAARFAQQADAIQQMIQRVRGSMGKLEDGGWIGRGATAFFEEMHSEVMPACQRFYDALNDASQATKETIQIVQTAEREASAPFKRS